MHTCDMWETRGDKSSGMRTNTGTPREGEHTIQHRHTCGETMGDNESNGGHWETMGGKGRQELAKADTTSNTGTHMWGDNGETRPREGEHIPTQEYMCHNGRQGETRGDKTSGRRPHHPTQAHMWGDKGRQDLGKADTPSNIVTHVWR